MKMNLRQIRFVFSIIMFSGFLQSSFAIGSDEFAESATSDLSSLRLRAKLGSNVKFDPVLTGNTSVGLDISRSFAKNFDLTASIDRVYYSGSMKSYFFGLTPSFSKDCGKFHFNWGAFAGIKIFNPGSFTLEFNNPQDYSYFALGPVGNVDFDIFRSVFIHGSIRYLRSLGSDLGSGYDLLAMGGVGLKF